MKRFTLIGLLLTLLLLLSCTSSKRKIVIGVSQCSEDNWRDYMNGELRMASYEYDHVELAFASTKDNDEQQIHQIDSLIRMGVDLLIISPNQLHTISPIIEKAYDKGIPVILFDRKTDSKKYTAFIGADNYQIGRLMGQFIAKTLKGKGNVVEIEGLLSSSPAIDRHRGFMEAMSHYPGIQVLASKPANWLQAPARALMDSLLRIYPKIDCVFGQDDRMALGAREAAIAHHRDKEMIFVGIDALPVKGGGMESVRDGILKASYSYPTRGDLVMQLAMKILQKRPYQRENHLQSTLVTQDNAEQMLMVRSEFADQISQLEDLHTRVDTYLAQYQQQRIVLVLLGILTLLLIAFFTYIYRSILVKRQMEERQTQAKLQFFTNISHELRTPLTLIIDPIQQISDDPQIKGRSRELLDLIKRNTQSLMQMVNEILDFRKIQNGKMALRLSRTNMAVSLRQWVEDFMPSAQKKKIRLSVNTAACSHPEIIADEPKVARIVFNLLSNAMKYTPSGGSIAVTLSDEGNDRISLQVRDSGKGIEKADQAKIFERFFQSKGATSGTGIGLALVKAFTELHHGQVTVKSEPDKGSTFTVTIPCWQQGEIEAEQTATRIDEATLQYLDDGERGDSNTVKIIGTGDGKPMLLVIDDNHDIRTYLRNLLNDRYIVEEAADGEEGLKKARKEVPDLVICDMMMPVMDGLDFCKNMKADLSTSHIPIIMLTAKNLDEKRIEGYEQGADSYLTKPFNGKVLMARIDNLLQSRRQLRNLFQAEEGSSPLPSTRETKLRPGKKDQDFIHRLHDIIQQNIADSDFNVESISAEIGLSRVQLYRKVKALTGTSVVDLMRKARLAKGRSLLETTDMSISQVAYEVGFTTPSYFTKCFKEEFGMNPNELRK